MPASAEKCVATAALGDGPRRDSRPRLSGGAQLATFRSCHLERGRTPESKDPGAVGTAKMQEGISTGETYLCESCTVPGADVRILSPACDARHSTTNMELSTIRSTPCSQMRHRQPPN